MDLSAIIRRAIEIGEQRGFLTFDQINELLPAHETKGRDIEALFEALVDRGIDVRDASSAALGPWQLTCVRRHR
jgi:Sigma-70 factor, region 1.1